MDEKTIQAIKESINHHKFNLNQLKSLSGHFRTSLWGHFFVVGGVHLNFNCETCALCHLFKNHCEDCPLEHCEEGSVWEKLKYSETKEEAIKAEEEMIKCLEELL